MTNVCVTMWNGLPTGRRISERKPMNPRMRVAAAVAIAAMVLLSAADCKGGNASGGTTGGSTDAPHIEIASPKPLKIDVENTFCRSDKNGIVKATITGLRPYEAYEVAVLPDYNPPALQPGLGGAKPFKTEGRADEHGTAVWTLNCGGNGYAPYPDNAYQIKVTERYGAAEKRQAKGYFDIEHRP